MSVVTRSQFAGNLLARINNNTTGDITPLDVRSVFDDLADSVIWPEDGSDSGSIGLKGSPVGSDKVLGFDSEASSQVVRYSLTAIAGLMNNILSLSADRITSGTFANARISQSSVIQHATAVAIASNAVRSLVAGIGGADAVTNIVSLTQAEYDALGTKDSTTLYVIVD